MTETPRRREGHNDGFNRLLAIAAVTLLVIVTIALFMPRDNGARSPQPTVTGTPPLITPVPVPRSQP